MTHSPSPSGRIPSSFFSSPSLYTYFRFRSSKPIYDNTRTIYNYIWDFSLVSVDSQSTIFIYPIRYISGFLEIWKILFSKSGFKWKLLRNLYPVISGFWKFPKFCKMIGYISADIIYPVTTVNPLSLDALLVASHRLSNVKTVSAMNGVWWLKSNCRLHPTFVP